jgi:hypothetical protein
LIKDSLSLKQTIEQADLIVTGNRIFDKTESANEEPQLIKVQFARVLKGKARDNQAAVRSFYGMCPYGIVLPDEAPRVLFLSESAPENPYGEVDNCSVKTLSLAGDKGETVTLEDGKTKISLDEFLSERIIRTELKPIVKFLQLLKNGEDKVVFGFDESKGGKWNSEELLSLLSTKGVEFSDVNEKLRKRRLTFVALRRSLAGKKDRIWRQFVHLGHIYNQPYPQYSTLTFSTQANRVVAELTGSYRLTFSREGGALKLTKLEYLQLEGD